MVKSCELCGERASLYCIADDAKLCWSCDAEVHGANFLVARHMRSLLCVNCSAETDCQTSGPHPSPLSRSCSACDPAHVEAEPDVKEIIVRECKDDSEDMRVAVPGPLTSVSQESNTDAHSSVEDGQKAKPKRMRGGGCRAVQTKRTAATGQARRVTVSIKKQKKKRSGSPVSVISSDGMVSNETWDDDDDFGFRYVKAKSELLSLLPPRP